MKDYDLPDWETLEKPLCEDCGGIVRFDGFCEDCGMEQPENELSDYEWLKDEL